MLTSPFRACPGLLFPLLASALFAACSTGGEEDDDDDSSGGTETGYAVGDVATDFTLPDQDGEAVTLSQFQGSRILLDFSALWCAPCAEAAEGANGMQEELSQEFPFQYVMVIIQDEQLQPAQVEHAAYWAYEFGLTIPVLADEVNAVAAGYLGAEGMGNLPQFFLLDEEFVIRDIRVGYGTGDEQALKDALRGL